MSFPNGLFHCKEATLRITEDRQWVSAFDVIQMVGEQKNFRTIWDRIEKNNETEVVPKWYYFKFPGSGQRDTPCVNAKGLVLLLMQIPGEKAKQFRSAGADILVRYLGGDTTLIGEIEAINETHIRNPENPASFFRNSEIVQRNLGFSRDQLNNSNKLLHHFGSMTDVLYMIIFDYNGSVYMKFGIVFIRTFEERFMEHVNIFGDGNIKDICIYSAMKCNDVTKIESEFKKTTFYKVNKTDLNINGVNMTEIIELTDNITSEDIKSEINKVAGDRIIDPPPSYNEISNNSYLIEQEKTKQLEYNIELEKLRETQQFELKLKELELKSKELELEKSKIELEKMKINERKNTKEAKIEKNDKVFEWCIKHIRYDEDSICKLSKLCTEYFKNLPSPSNKEKGRFRREFELYLKLLQRDYPKVNTEYKSSSEKGHTYQGWKHIRILNTK